MKVTPLRKNVRLGIVLSLLVKPPIKKNFVSLRNDWNSLGALLGP